MPTRDDLRELAVLTALGVALGLLHLAARPDLPWLSAPPALCEQTAPLAPPAPEPEMSRMEDDP